MNSVHPKVTSPRKLFFKPCPDKKRRVHAPWWTQDRREGAIFRENLLFSQINTFMGEKNRRRQRRHRRKGVIFKKDCIFQKTNFWEKKTAGGSAATDAKRLFARKNTRWGDAECRSTFARPHLGGSYLLPEIHFFRKTSSNVVGQSYPNLQKT